MFIYGHMGIKNCIMGYNAAVLGGITMKISQVGDPEMGSGKWIHWFQADLITKWFDDLRFTKFEFDDILSNGLNGFNGLMINGFGCYNGLMIF